MQVAQTHGGLSTPMESPKGDHGWKGFGLGQVRFLTLALTAIADQSHIRDMQQRGECENPLHSPRKEHDFPVHAGVRRNVRTIRQYKPNCSAGELPPSRMTQTELHHVQFLCPGYSRDQRAAGQRQGPISQR